MKRSEEKMSEYVVYAGGRLTGLGCWSGPHKTRKEAEKWATGFRVICGGDPLIIQED